MHFNFLWLLFVALRLTTLWDSVLKSDIIENSRIELRGIALLVPSNQIKVIFIIILPFNLVHL